MARLKRIGMTALFTIFTLLGLLIAAFGEGPNRLLGLAVVLFMGGGGVGWFLVTAAQQHTGLRIGTVRAFGRQETGFIADYDRRRQLASAIGALAMGVASAVFGVVPDGEGSTVVPTWLGIGLAVLLGGIGLLGIARGGRASQLVLTRRGLVAISAPGPIFVPWDGITAIGETEVRGNPFLVVQVADPAAVEMGRLQRAMHVVQRTVMNIDLSFPLLTMRTDPRQVRAAVERYVQQPDLRTSIGTTSELAAVHTSSPIDANPERGQRGRRVPVLRIAAGVSLLLFGALLAIVSLAAALDEVAPAQERGRMIGLIVFGAVALAQVVAGVLFLRGVAAGRWIGPIAALAVLGVGLLGLAAGDGDSRPARIVIVGIVAVHALLVALGALRWGADSV